MRERVNGDVVIKQFSMSHGWGGVDTYTLTCMLSLKITRRGIMINNITVCAILLTVDFIKDTGGDGGTWPRGG